MKNIGMFYENKLDAIEDYRHHSQSANSMARMHSVVTVNPKEMTVTIDQLCWRYYVFKEFEDVQRIAGIQFDSVFCEVRNPKIKSYIMTRFRPRLT